MKVRILFFAAAADAANARSKDLDLPENSRILNLGSFVLSEYPPLAGLPLVYAVNQQYVSPNQLLKDGDEVAVFAPVSGG